jgi:molecular chaperone DnaK
MGYIIGIDLGTSTTEAAVFQNGKPVLIPDHSGDVIVPSVVGLDDEGRIIVGKQADERYLLYPDRTVKEVKRLMGSGQKVSMGQEQYTPADISAELLSSVKHYAENFLGGEVDRAVITVPAYFTNQQRNETIEAGKLAGLSVERIINEPTAAALCYGIDHMEEESHILVYDFGGGTFDVTLLELFEGVLEVKASSGDNCLGGKDFDEKLVQYFLDLCRQNHGIDLKDDIYAMVKLKDAAVKCKIALSSQESYEVLIPMLSQKNGVPLSLHTTVTVTDFNERIRGLVEKTREAVELVLKDGHVSKDKIDLVLLTGGSTRIPYIKQYVAELFGKEPAESIDPDLSVALGAGIQAGILDGMISHETGIMITDVAPYALGVKTVIDEGDVFYDDYMDILIPRNITIPATRKKRYYTCAIFQTKCEIEVYQGEKKKATDNAFLGKFMLSGIPPKMPGEEGVDIEFAYDVNGILKVHARVVSTGEAASIVIETAGAGETVDLETWKEASNAGSYRSTIRKTEKLLAGELDGEDRMMLEEGLRELKLGLIHGEAPERLSTLELELIDLAEEITWLQ